MGLDQSRLPGLHQGKLSAMHALGSKQSGCNTHYWRPTRHRLLAHVLPVRIGRRLYPWRCAK